MNIGFTATRQGLTAKQLESLLTLLHRLQPTTVRHGAAIGGDGEIAAICDRLERRPRIIAHPSDMSWQTDAAALALSDEVMEAKPPLVRNRDIVDGCDLLIALPYREVEEMRSGTWMTIRCARRVGRNLIIVWPDGRTTDVGGKALTESRNQT